MTAVYPSSPSARTHWILEQRGVRNTVLPDRAYAVLEETERGPSGERETVATVFLTNKECPWKCVMCDLWRNTTRQSIAPHDVLRQIQEAIPRVPAASVLKLYNSGSFFDPGAIPREAWHEIASLCCGFKRLIVECHPRLVGPRVFDFAALLGCSLEVAIGLETAHPSALEKLNKRATVGDYLRAAEFLTTNGISLRTFLLVNPPFVCAAEQGRWMERSLQVAFQANSDVVSLIPLRGGNGAVEKLIESGEAHLPTLSQIEAAHEQGLGQGRCRVFADTWDLRLFSRCEECFDARRARIERMNLSQSLERAVPCVACGHG